MRSVQRLLDVTALRLPESTAVRDASGCDTYATLSAESRMAARGLWSLGVRPGDRVVLRLLGGRAFAAALYGALRLGAVAVPVNPATGPFHLRWILMDAAPRLVVTETADVAAMVGYGVPGVVDPGELRAAASRTPEAPPHEGGGDDLALLMYTSGSTAMPRAVACPHTRVCFAVDAIAARLRYRPDDVVLSRIPVSFDYGLYQLFLSAHAGATLVVRPDLVPAAILRVAAATGATVLPIVPSLGSILLRSARRNGARTSVRLLTNTGAALNPALTAGLRQLFPDAQLVPMYGMTECKRITIADPDEDLAFPGTVGRALDGTEVLVVDDARQPVGPGITGEILVRGPHVMAGYWRAPEATACRFGAWNSPEATLSTGDYGYLDAGGRLYFVGRRDDIFKRRSVRMSTREVEAAVLDVPAVSAAAALPPEPDGTLTVYVVGDTTGAQVLAAVAERVEPARVPDRCVVVPAIPTTVNGKVDKKALRALHDDGQTVGRSAAAHRVGDDPS